LNMIASNLARWQVYEDSSIQVPLISPQWFLV
jgi:hypothetical protein